MIRSIVHYWAPPLLWAALIFYLSSISSLGPNLGSGDSLIRSAGHSVEYAVLTFLLWRALHHHRLRWFHAVLWSALLALAYAVIDEIHQGFVPGRNPTIRDILADGVGIIIVAVSLQFLKPPKGGHLDSPQ